MLVSTKPVGECSTQELLEALMLQASFNQFNPKQVLSDLYAHPDLWTHFLMGPQIIEREKFCRIGLFMALRDIGYRWHADTLYIHSRDDECVFPLIELGKTWKCDDVEVFDRERTSSLMGMYPDPAPVVAYWWD